MPRRTTSALTPTLPAVEESPTALIRPLYAVAGAGDIAVEQLRSLPTRAAELQSRAAELPGKARQLLTGQVGLVQARTTEAYDELVGRGQKLVTAVQTQPATRALTEQVRETSRAARTTAGTARDSVSRTRNAARSVADSARKSATRTGAGVKETAVEVVKTAEVATHVVEDGAAKLGPRSATD